MALGAIGTLVGGAAGGGGGAGGLMEAGKGLLGKVKGKGKKKKAEKGGEGKEAGGGGQADPKQIAQMLAKLLEVAKGTSIS
jgi:hypothetical protein